MPDVLASAWATPGLGWIVLAAFVGGLVRGFSGFGTAMIFLPVAGQFLSPVAALTVMTVMDAVGPLPIVRRAWRDSDPHDVARLLVGLVVTMPIGLAILIVAEPEVFRYAVSGIALVLLTCLIAGFRYRGSVRPPLVYGIGGIAGFMGGVAGVPGPPVILFYMASPHPVSVIRANTLLFLLGYDLLMLALLEFNGVFTTTNFFLGVLMIVPIVAGNILGSAIFRPRLEKPYRAVAYMVIAVSAISGLPLLD